MTNFKTDFCALNKATFTKDIFVRNRNAFPRGVTLCPERLCLLSHPSGLVPVCFEENNIKNEPLMIDTTRTKKLISYCTTHD